ncbi:MAG: transposase, partial [Muribaculaceae bacterium]
MLVLALSINTEGFIRYSEILEGNTADPKSLPDMAEHLMAKNGTSAADKTLVVIDAGIATEDNLALLKQKGYNYLCVSRTKLTNYTLAEDSRSVTVCDSRKRQITLREVHTEPGSDYFLEVTSPSKAMAEASMNRQWRERFEQQMQRINDGIARKGGTKRYEKVIERVGRAIQQYPSIAKYYDVI